jgi:hypothetical protein
MKPERHVTFPEEIGKLLAETQLTPLDRLRAAAAFGTATGGGSE